MPDAPLEDVDYEPRLSEIQWVVPADNLPEETPALASNNNVSIQRYEGRLFLAWRTAPTHFASEKTALHVISSADEGLNWDFEASFALGADLREPLLYQAQGTLFLTFFQGGIDPLAFEPQGSWRSSRKAAGDWRNPVAWGEPLEVPWEVIHHNERLYLTTYIGAHYELDEPTELDLRFWESTDGENWEPVSAAGPVVYTGGVSEAAFHFDVDGDLWAVLRNEDGDDTGFGSHLCTAPADALGEWDCPEVSDEQRYDSPRMFPHAGELYLVARRDVGGAYGASIEADTFEERKAKRLVDYSVRPKRTALYRIDREARRIEHLLDFPSAGDTAFPSIVPRSEHVFTVANYTSPLNNPDITWIEGQTAPSGTQLYLVDVVFEAR